MSGPLSQLQLTKFNKDECFKLIKALNRALESRALEPSVLTNVFDKWWPDLDEKVKAALQIPVPTHGAAKRPERELLEEVLERVRALQMRPSGGIPPHRRPTPRAELAARQPSEVLLRELGLSARSYLPMREFGLRSLADLLALSEYELLCIPNFGKSSLVEVLSALKHYGLELRPMGSESAG